MFLFFLFYCFSFLFFDNIDDEDGEFKSKDDREYRYIVEIEKLRVIWNMERRCYLDFLVIKRCV